MRLVTYKFRTKLSTNLQDGTSQKTKTSHDRLNFHNNEIANIVEEAVKFPIYNE